MISLNKWIALVGGDSVNISLSGESLIYHTGVLIAPKGTISNESQIERFLLANFAHWHIF